jgi:hypothetical protein
MSDDDQPSGVSVGRDEVAGPMRVIAAGMNGKARNLRCSMAPCVRVVVASPEPRLGGENATTM